MTFDLAAQQLLIYVPGCPLALAAVCLRDAAIEYCKETMVLVTGSEVTFTPAAGTPVWDFAVDQILDVLEARIDGEPIPVLSLNDPVADDLEDDVYCVRFADANNLSITPAPTADLDVDLLIATAPGPAALTMHDSLWAGHHEALKHGALRRLYEIPKRAWSDPQLAGYYGGLFQQAMAKNKHQFNRNVSQTARLLTVRPA